jgi:DNA-binding transcriptional LysR family regulator
MLDRLTGMQVFTRVASLGSLSAAARALGMSQTMATKHLTAIEGRLGVKLMHRTTRRLTLTDAGRKYLETAERILAEIEESEADVAADRLEVRGSLRVSVPVSYGVRVIAPLIPAFVAEHPAVKLDLGLADRQVDLIEEGWDMAVRIGLLTGSTLHARKLAPCGTTVCASPAYLAHHGTPHTVADLAAHNCLGYTLSRTVGADVWQFGSQGQRSIKITGNLQANNGDFLLAAALRGQGIVYMPTYLVADALRKGDLVSLEFDQPTMDLPGIFAVYPSERRPPAKVRAFIDFLVAHLQSSAGKDKIRL